MKVVTFGEILLRLGAPGYTRLFQKDNLEATFCGGEANVAVSLSIFGVDTCFVTKLPQNDIGFAASNSLRYFGVDTSKILYDEGRMGLYYLEKGASQRSSKVIYDRKNSVIAEAKIDDFNWDMIFGEADWYHLTGITPALSDSLAQICIESCKIARQKGIVVSCDLNYRKNLWNSEHAERVMTKIMSYVDVCIANEEDAEKVFGIKPYNNDVGHGKLNVKGYVGVAEWIAQKFGCKHIALTLRESYSASVNGWSAMLYNSNNKVSYFSQKYNIQIIDRVGGGDSFAAGIIYGFISGMEEQEVLEFATASSCLKHTIEGDYNRISIDEVRKLMSSGGSGRVER